MSRNRFTNRLVHALGVVIAGGLMLLTAFAPGPERAFRAGAVADSTPTPEALPTETAASDAPTPTGAVTTTPAPVAPVTLTLNEAQAAQMAAERARAGGLTIANVAVTLRSGIVQLTGDVPVLFSWSHLTVQATPRVENGRLRFAVSTISMGGLDLSGWRATVESALDDAFAAFVAGYDVQSYTVQDGELQVQASQSQ